MSFLEASLPGQHFSSLNLSSSNHQPSKYLVRYSHLCQISHLITHAQLFIDLHFFLSLLRIPKTVGVSIPMKATFFITYIMVDGWAGIAAEILRVVPLVIFHLKNTFLVKTEQDRQQAMDPGHLDFATSEPRIQFYFLLGLVYAAVAPILLPFIIVFFAFAYVVFRHQVP